MSWLTDRCGDARVLGSIGIEDIAGQLHSNPNYWPE